jgi:hypothetical protein
MVTDRNDDSEIDERDELAERRRRRAQEPEAQRREEAVELAEEISEENPDPITRREAIELGLEDEGLADEGGIIGEHND